MNEGQPIAARYEPGDGAQGRPPHRVRLPSTLPPLLAPFLLLLFIAGRGRHRRGKQPSKQRGGFVECCCSFGDAAGLLPPAVLKTPFFHGIFLCCMITFATKRIHINSMSQIRCLIGCLIDGWTDGWMDGLIKLKGVGECGEFDREHEFDVVVCHGNVIRYFAMRALQLPVRQKQTNEQTNRQASFHYTNQPTS